MKKIIKITIAIIVLLSAENSLAIDGVNGVSDEQLIQFCKQSCLAISPSEYDSCFYCCTHDCQ